MAERFAELKPPKGRCVNYAGEPCNWIERLTFRAPDYVQRARRQINVEKLGIGDRNAVAIAGDADAYAAVWFGVGLVAGTVFTALGCALLSRNGKPKEES